MVGGVLIAHGALAESLLGVAESISGEVKKVKALTVGKGLSTDEIKRSLEEAVSEVDDGDGVIIFTDMLGGSPTNISLTVMEAGRVEVLTGVNLPMLLKFINNRADASFGELSTRLRDYGLKSIVLTSEILKGKG